MPDDLAEPVVTAASFFICWRAMGEAFTRHSLRPLIAEGRVHASLGCDPRRGSANARLLFETQICRLPRAVRRIRSHAIFAVLALESEPIDPRL
jgi:hypothetical protein